MRVFHQGPGKMPNMTVCSFAVHLLTQQAQRGLIQIWNRIGNEIKTQQRLKIWGSPCSRGEGRPEREARREPTSAAGWPSHSTAMLCVFSASVFIDFLRQGVEVFQ